MDVNKKTIVIAAIAAAVVVVAGTVLLFGGKSGISPFNPANGPGTGLVGETTGGTRQLPGGPATREAVSGNVVVPELTSANIAANVAKPQTVVPARPTGGASFRSFAIAANSNEFTPNTVIVKVGDTVHINIAAVDNNYDFIQPDYGFNVSIPKGQKKSAEFSATGEGKYTFYCKSCGGPEKGPRGYIIIVSSK